MSGRELHGDHCDLLTSPQSELMCSHHSLTSVAGVTVTYISCAALQEADHDPQASHTAGETRFLLLVRKLLEAASSADTWRWSHFVQASVADLSQHFWSGTSLLKMLIN